MKPNEQVAIQKYLNEATHEAKEFSKRISGPKTASSNILSKMTTCQFDGSTLNVWELLTDTDGAKYFVSITGLVIVHNRRAVMELRQYYAVHALRRYDWIVARNSLISVREQIETKK